MSEADPDEPSIRIEDATAAADGKAIHVLLVSVMTELAALRRTLLETPELRQRYEEYLRDATELVREILKRQSNPPTQ